MKEHKKQLTKKTSIKSPLVTSILKLLILFKLVAILIPSTTLYHATEEGGSFKIKRSGFKELKDEEKEDPDSKLVDMTNRRFAYENNGNYTGGNLGNKTAGSKAEGDGTGDSKDDTNKGSNDPIPSEIKSSDQGVAPIEQLDKMKKSGTKENCKSYHIDSYKSNTAMLYSVGGKYTIGIDAGHQQDTSKYIGKGMSSGTAARDGTPEYKITQQYANTCKDILLKAGYNVVMTRITNDADISNQDRGRLFAQTQCDIGISFHTDSSGAGSHGFTPCISNWDPPNDVKAKAYGEVFRSKLAAKGTGITTTRGTQVKDGYALWSKAKGVPVILLEVGFINNPPDDWDLVKSDSYRASFCTAVEEALEEYIGKPE